MSAPVAGTGPVLALASNQNNPNSLFVDATTVFYANADAVMKVAR
jgi:hypothetical protein